MSDDARTRTALLVLGMHRSGTSALARVLNLLGTDLGPSLLPANADNDTGFWEPREIVALHDELLAALGTSWHDPRPLPREALAREEVRPFRRRLVEILRRDFASAPLVGFKDPRLCRLVPLWRDVLAEAGLTPAFLLTCRHPDEVCASLAARNGMSRSVARLSWLDHVLAAERDSRGAPRAFVTYEGLLADWRGSMRRAMAALPLGSEADLEAAAPAIDSYLDSTKRHHASRATGKLPSLLQGALAAWERAAAGEDATAAFDALRRRFADGADLLLPWADELRAKVDEEHRALEVRGARVAKLSARVAELETSKGSLAAPSPASSASVASVVTPARPLLERSGTRVARTFDVAEGHPRVSIVIPLYGQVELTEKCLTSLAAHTEDGSYEVILVDNGSSDGTPELLASLEGNVKIVVNETNLGFAVACNQGAALAATPNVLFLNNDVEARPGWLPPLLDVLERDPSAGVVGAKLLFPDGRIQHAGVALLRRANAAVPIGAFHVHYGEPADLPAASRASEYQVVTGACLLARKRLFDDAGGFDEFFWNGCEDVDFCLKAREKGWKVVYEPKSVLVHHESRSGPERWSRTRANEMLLASRWSGRVEADLVEENGSRHRTEAGRIRDWVAPAEAGSGTPAAASPDALTSIVILTRNQREHTRLCVASIERRTPEPHEIVFVDNGSTDGTREYLESLVATRENVRVVANATNRGFAAGNNQALSLARGRRIVLLNNDTVVTEGWLGGLHDVLDSHPEAGLVGPVTNRASGPQVVSVPYRTLAEMDAFAASLFREREGASEPAGRIVGFCWLMRREVVDAIGGLDERFGSGNCEDDDYCLRAHQHGFGTRIARGVFVHHVGSRTFVGEKIDYRESLLRNFELFKEKWGLPAEARADAPYPFQALVAKERRPRVALPDLAATHEPKRGGRWLEDRRSATGPAETASPSPAAQRSAAHTAPARATRPPRESVATTSRRLLVGVVGTEGEVGPGPRDLLARYGHEGPPPRWRRSPDVAEALRSDGLVLLLGPDVTVPEEALRELVSVAASSAKVAVVGPVSNAAPISQRVGPRDARAAEAPLIAAKRRRRHGGRWTEEPWLGGFCLLVNASTVAEAGGLSETLPLEDALLELFGRLKAAGFLVACARGAWVHHAELTVEEGRGYGMPAAEAAASVAQR